MSVRENSVLSFAFQQPLLPVCIFSSSSRHATLKPTNPFAWFSCGVKLLNIFTTDFISVKADKHLRENLTNYKSWRLCGMTAKQNGQCCNLTLEQELSCKRWSWNYCPSCSVLENESTLYDQSESRIQHRYEVTNDAFFFFFFSPMKYSWETPLKQITKQLIALGYNA